MKSRIWTASLASVIAAGALTIGAVAPAHAESGKEKAYRIGTYAGAAATAYGIVKGSPGIAIAGAAGTYLAHKGWKDEVDDRHDDRWRGRRSGRYDDYRSRGRYDVYGRDYGRRDDCDRDDYRRGSYGRRRR
jgi:hypothetical protein